HNIKSDIGEKNYARSPQNTAPAEFTEMAHIVRYKWPEIFHLYIEYAESDEEQNDQQLDYYDHVIECRRFLYSDDQEERKYKHNKNRRQVDDGAGSGPSQFRIVNEGG